MSEMSFSLGEGSVRIEFDEELYPKDAVYGAAYVFIDRCYVHLDRVADRRIQVMLRAKKGAALSSDALIGEFQNELLGQAFRLRLADENRQFIEAITSRALGGAAGPPGLDELLAMDIGAETAFEDPLGIAMSWEEKYKKKGAKAQEPNGAGDTQTSSDDTRGSAPEAARDEKAT